MKYIAICFTILSVAGAGLLVLNMFTSKPFIKAEIKVPLSINQIEGEEYTPLSQEEQDEIKNCLKKHVTEYNNASLFILKERPLNMLDTSNRLRFNVVIEGKNGCILQNKPTITTRNNLVFQIKKQIDQGFTVLDKSRSGNRYGKPQYKSIIY